MLTSRRDESRVMALYQTNAARAFEIPPEQSQKPRSARRFPLPTMRSLDNGDAALVNAQGVSRYPLARG